MPRLRFHITLTIFSLTLVGLVAVVSLANLHRLSQVAVRANAEELFKHVSQGVENRVVNMLTSALGLARNEAVSSLATLPFPDPGKSFPAETQRLQDRLLNDPTLYSLYLAHDNGDFFQLIAPRGHGGILAAHKAPESTHTILRVIRTGEDGLRRQHWHFLDESGKSVENRTEDNPAYDPRQRPWYQKAMGVDSATLSAPYVFSSSKQLGITASRTFPGKRGVVGVDITLEGLRRFISGQLVSPHNSVAIVDSQRQVLAMARADNADLRLAPLSPLDGLADSAVPGIAAALSLGKPGFAIVPVMDAPVLSYMSNIGGTVSLPLQLVVQAPQGDFSEHMDSMERRILWDGLLMMLVMLPITLLGSRRMSLTLGRLASDADRIRRFDFSPSQPLQSFIVELAELGQAFTVMRDTIAQRTRAMEESQAKLKQLVQGGIALASETDPDKLLKSILWSGKAISQADAATLYLRTPDNHLRFALRTKSDVLPSFTIPLNDPATGAPNHRYVATHVALCGMSVRVDDVYTESRFDLSGTRKFDAESGYHTTSMLTVPLKPRDGDTIGVLQFINAMDPGTGQAVPFDAQLTEFVEALASQAAVALDNLNLLEAQKKLFDSVIQIIAGAIDAKSPYT
ncbi:MAG: GAF domain-containing protein, partial [Magnetococcus sp. WYHC-3]